MNTHKLLLTACLLLPEFAAADAIPTPIPDPNDFTVTSYLAGSYNYLQRSNRFTSGAYNRQFDLEPNGFTLQQAAITLAKQPHEGWGGLANFIFGRDALQLASYGIKSDTGIHNMGWDVEQLYLQYATGPLTFIGGKFNSLAGSSEGSDLTQNPNFSASLLSTFAVPSTHMGVRGTYALNDKVNLIAGVNNGWDSIRDTSRGKTVELGIAYVLNPFFSFAISGYSGDQRSTDRVASGPTGRRNLIDLLATLHATEKLTLIANYDYGTQINAVLPDGTQNTAAWQAIAGYINYKLNEQWHISLRGDDFSDQDGYRTGVTQNLQELTFTLGYAPIKCLELRIETRRDFSNKNWFVDYNGTSVKNNQQSYALEALYKF